MAAGTAEAVRWKGAYRRQVEMEQDRRRKVHDDDDDHDPDCRPGHGAGGQKSVQGMGPREIQPTGGAAPVLATSSQCRHILSTV